MKRILPILPSLCAAGMWLSSCPSGSAGTILSSPGAIVFAGADVDTVGGAWRTATVPKSDIDGDNVLGADGWYVSNIGMSVPAYLSSLSDLGNPLYPGNAGYAVIDDPRTTPGGAPSTILSGTQNPFPGTGNTNVDLTFTFGNTVPDTVRLGLMIDNLDIALYNPSAVQVSEVGGMSSPTIDVTSASYNDRQPDWLYFDFNPQPGSTYDVIVTGGINGCACLAAAAFDSVPEPWTFGMAGLAFGLLALSRRRLSLQ